jgi:cyclopropane fatty-acyl-phospholipid synthase-like methyltransferase
MSDSNKAGHTFLASLGKTRLRPGGTEATEWLFAQAGLNKQSQVLEIACNMGTTAIEMVSRFGCRVHAVDMDKQALSKARENVAAAGLSDRIQLSEANANHLPFPDNSFDVVINEAMLTMYADKAKQRLAREYYRVLKPGGCLLTHDIMLTRGELAASADSQLQQVVKSNVSPMSKEKWQAMFYEVGFSQVQTHNGDMSLMSPRGMIKDEGLLRTLKIAFNGLKNRENRQRFLGMFRYFRTQRHNMNYIACCSRKA